MKCNICGHNMEYKETVTLSSGKVVDIYVCPECGFHKRDG